MKEQEAAQRIRQMRTDRHQFVKWWRREEDFLDYELIDHFVGSVAENREIEGFQLLTMDEMWHELHRIGAQVEKRSGPGGDKLEWVHKGRSGMRTMTCDYTPQSLLAIFDVETRGNPVDS